MKEKYSCFFYLFVIGFFLLIVSSRLFSDGMFMDGLFYSVISKNLAAGLGDFWHLHFSNTAFNVFYEHPPLVFGIQSVFFMIFGDNILVERIYSLLTFIITGIFIYLIWKQIVEDNKKIKLQGGYLYFSGL